MADKPAWRYQPEADMALAEARAAGAVVILVAWETTTSIAWRTIPGPSDAIGHGMVGMLTAAMQPDPEPDEPDEYAK